MDAGVKDESFAVSLSESEEAVNAAQMMLRIAGWSCLKLERLEGHPDHGDLLIYKQRPNGTKHSFQTVDVKRNANWTGHSFPYDTMYVTTQKELHYGWWYVVFSASLSQVAFIDMNAVPLWNIEFDETTNRRGGGQISAGIPARYIKFKNGIT